MSYQDDYSRMIRGGAIDTPKSHANMVADVPRVGLRQADEWRQDLIVPTHTPPTAEEHNKFPNGRW